MATDFFGVERNVNSHGQIATSELATIDLGGGGSVALVQQATWSYQLNVQPVYEAGSAELYWNTGQPQGTISMDRIVGSDGYLAEFSSLQGGCGTLQQITVGLGGTGGCTVSDGPVGSDLTFSGAVPIEVRGSFGAGMREVSEGVTIRCAGMS